MIDEKEYSRMEFNPVVKKSLTVVYPKLKDIVGSVDDKQIRYIILMYDINSPLRNHYPDLARRKEFAASIAGYDLSSDQVEELFEFKVKGDLGEFVPNEQMLKVIIDYLMYTSSRVWSLIVSNEQFFYECAKRVLVPVEDDRDKDLLTAVSTKTKLIESMDAINERLQRYYKDLSGGDTQLEEVITKRKRLSPESIATR